MYSNITKIYCPEGNTKCMNYTAMQCDKNSDITSEECINTTVPMSTQPQVSTYKKEPNGNYIIDGVRYSSYANMAKGEDGIGLKRIYTVKEANEATGMKNKVMIKYK